MGSWWGLIVSFSCRWCKEIPILLLQRLERCQVLNKSSIYSFEALKTSFIASRKYFSKEKHSGRNFHRRQETWNSFFFCCSRRRNMRRKRMVKSHDETLKMTWKVGQCFASRNSTFRLIFQTVIKSDFDIFMFAFLVDWSNVDCARATSRNVCEFYRQKKKEIILKKVRTASRE